MLFYGILYGLVNRNSEMIWNSFSNKNPKSIYTSFKITNSNISDFGFCRDTDP